MNASGSAGVSVSATECFENHNISFVDQKSRSSITYKNKSGSLNLSTTTSSTESTTPIHFDYIVIADYHRPRKRSFWQKYGRILLIAVGISLGVACISFLIVVINCYRVTALKRRATVALTLPIPLLPEDQTLLHTEPDNSVPMLSVQTAGCAGMERLGVPTCTTLNSPPDDRGQYSCRMRLEALPAREILLRSETVIRSNNTSNSFSGSNSSSSSSSNNHQKQQQQQHNLLHLEHHNQHSHHQQQQHHHHYQQQQQLQQQHYQRMSAQQQHEQQQQQQQQSASGSGSNARHGSNTPARSNNSSINNNNNSNFMRGGIEASGSGDAGSYSSSSGNTTASNSSCNSHSIDHHQHYQQARQLKQRLTPHCPHHVPLPDSEWGQDRNMQIRASYQQSELTRSYIKPPPNKTIKDVPEQSSYNLANALTVLAGSNATLYASTGTQLQQQHQQQQQKSKPNVITKLFSRKSSPKSPTALTSSSSSSSAASACSSLALSASITSMPASASSSASSIASVTGGGGGATSAAATTSSTTSALVATPIATLPIATAATLKTTACNYGAANTSLQSSTPPSITAGLAPSTQLLTTIGVSPTATTAISMERIPTPPLSVTVPIGAYHQHQHHNQREQQAQLQRFYLQQQQQMLLDSIVAESATPTTSLQALKSSSCELAMSGATTERHSSRNSLNAMDCYPVGSGDAIASTTTTTTTCNCNRKDCKICETRART